MKSTLYSRLGNPILSAVVFFLTVGVLSVGYAAFSSLGSVNSGDMLTSALWNKMSANLDDLDARSAANTSGLSSLTTQVTTNTSWITALNTSISSLTTQINTLSGTVSSIAANTSPWGKNGLAIYYTGGNVGIGTMSPVTKLDVNGNIWVQGTIYNPNAANNGYVVISGDSSWSTSSASIALWGRSNPSWAGDAHITSNGTGSIRFFNYKSTWVENMHISDNGNVGIGTTTPDTSLTVARSVPSSTAHPSRAGIIAEWEWTDVWGRVGARVYGSVETPWFMGWHANGTKAIPTALTIGMNLTGLSSIGYDGVSWVWGGALALITTENWTSTNHGSAITFSNTANGNTAYRETMRIDQNGNVGIGTTSPWYKLETTTGSPGTQAKFGPNAYISTWNDNSAYFSNGGTFNSAGAWTARATGASTIVNEVNGIRFLSNSGLTAGNTFSPTERMRIDQNGNVGIGINSSSLSPRLNVYKVISGGLPVTTWSDQPNALMRIGWGSVALDTGINTDGTFWMQTNLIGNNAGHYNLLLNPNWGNIGIGGTTANNPLYVSGNQAANFGNSGAYPTSSGYTLGISENTSVTGRLATIQFHDAGAQEAFIRLEASGRMFSFGDSQWAGAGIAIWNPAKTAYAIQLLSNGSAYAAAYYYNSDRSLKKDIVPLNSALDKIRRLNGYSFSWKDTGRKDIGVIAQEVEQVFPEIVGTRESTSGSTIKTVEYGNLVAPLIESVKELANKQDALEKENQSLRKRLESLESRK